MNLIRRIPMIPLQEAIYKALKKYQDTCNVYDNVPKDAKLPYMVLNSFEYKPTGSKDVDKGTATVKIGIYSEYEGKTEVNQIADEATAILTSVPLDLSVDNFSVLNQDTDTFEAFPEETYGYYGELTFIAEIQNLGR